MAERGEIRDRYAATQVRDFRGLRYGRITPTDIDAYLEFSNRLFVFVEAKFGGAPIKRGQLLAIERLTDAVHMPPRRYAAAIVVDHLTLGGDVDYGQAPVRAWRWAGKWRQPKERGITLRRALDRLVAAYGTADVVRLMAREGAA